MNIPNNIKSKTYGRLLNTHGGVVYSRKITDGLWTILARATAIAQNKKKELINAGKSITLPIKNDLKVGKKLSFVIYHVPFDKNKNQSIGSFDVPNIDHSKIKHQELVQWTIKAIEEVCPHAEIILCTDQEFGDRINNSKVKLIYPNVDKEKPMYFRARTYNTLVQKKMLGEQTVFLDSDAIVLKDPFLLLDKIDSNIAVTSRYAPNLMPINEGVIIANTDTEDCKDFFAHYMGTYERICKDEIIQGITGNDLMRWRGGQLSLNAICNGGKMIDYRDSTDKLSILPCDVFNYTVKQASEIEELKREGRVYIAHIKGKAKLSMI